VHRDLKPANIFLAEQDGFCPKIIDFGIACRREADHSLTGAGVLIGSPAYMSPEQCKGLPVNHLTDIYSMGCIMYEALMGEAPHIAGTPMELMYRHLTVTPRSLLLLGATPTAKRLGKLVDRCLSRDSQARPQSAAELLVELNNCFAEMGDSEKFLQVKQAVVSGQKRKPAIIALAVASLAIAATLVYYAVLRGSVPEKHKSVVITNELAGKKKQIERLKQSADHFRTYYEAVARRPDSDAEKQSRARDLLERLLVLATSQHDLKLFADEEKTLNEALPCCAVASTESGYTGSGVLQSLAACYECQTRFDQAERVLQKAAVSSPERGDVHFSFARLYVYSRKFEKAIKEFKEGVNKERLLSFNLMAIQTHELAESRACLYAKQLWSTVRAEPWQDMPDRLSALAFINEMAGFFSSQDTQYFKDCTQIARAIVQTVPADTPGFKPVAEKTYRLLAGCALQEGNKTGAAEFARIAESIRLSAKQ
jgi:tetratricopeptide (TPR) repeat protein